MCGYCTESAVISDLVGRLKGDAMVTHEPFYYPIHLQESVDWRKELRLWEIQDHRSGSLVTLCRQWSELIAASSPSFLRDALDKDALAERQSWLASFDYSPEWEWVLCAEGTLPNPLPIELARVKLDTHIAALIASSRSDALDWDHEALYKEFLSVSIAFDIVVQSAEDKARLRLLATLSPGQPPAFDALALWLQRRALHACVARYGVRFIDETWNELRVEAIISIVIGNLLNRSDLLELQAALMGRLHKSMNLGTDDLFEALEVKTAQERSNKSRSRST